MAAVLTQEEDLHFASVMVQYLNAILLTSSELFDLRNELKKTPTKVSPIHNFFFFFMTKERPIRHDHHLLWCFCRLVVVCLSWFPGAVSTLRSCLFYSFAVTAHESWKTMVFLSVPPLAHDCLFPLCVFLLPGLSHVAGELHHVLHPLSLLEPQCCRNSLTLPASSGLSASQCSCQDVVSSFWWFWPGAVYSMGCSVLLQNFSCVCRVLCVQEGMVKACWCGGHCIAEMESWHPRLL